MIGVFDSGYGGLTVLKEFVRQLPGYDYCYLGDNARTPYGTRSFETVYRYTLECVQHLFGQGCKLVILACNTASAKALRNIQQRDLPEMSPDGRVLGVIRPSVEIVGTYTQTGHVGILGTVGTVQSMSYPIEIAKLNPHIRVFQEACPMWVSLVESNEHQQAGADYFVRQHINRLLQQSAAIDTIILACTHYPLLLDKIRQYTPERICIITQGHVVSQSLCDYLHRHPEIEQTLGKTGKRIFQTTDSPEIFDRFASPFFGASIQSAKVTLR
ncbi:MAG: glutamate racemase [Bacteroidales bacterium]|jgi:glutamate racemase|nr:glutamate racemase [Bacteroidales bacterium]